MKWTTERTPGYASESDRATNCPSRSLAPIEMTNSGTEFELFVFQELSELLSIGALGFDPSLAKLYHQRSYYSEARKANIKVDVALELFLDGADTPFFVWIFECKDHGRSVSVADLETFDAKLQQIGANNTKGTVISRSEFQQSAIEFAKSRRLGLVRLAGTKLMLSALRSPLRASDEEIAENILTKEIDPAEHFDDFELAAYDHEFTRPQSWSDLFTKAVQRYKPHNQVICACCALGRPCGLLEVSYRLGRSMVWRSYQVCSTCRWLTWLMPWDEGADRFIAVVLGVIGFVVSLVELHGVAYIRRLGFALAVLVLPLLIYCIYRVLVSVVTRLRMRSAITFQNPWYIEREDLARILLARVAEDNTLDTQLMTFWPRFDFVKYEDAL